MTDFDVRSLFLLLFDASVDIASLRCLLGILFFMNKCGSLVLCNVAVNFVIFVLLVDLAAVFCLVDSKSKIIQTLKTRLAEKRKKIRLIKIV